MASQLTSLLTRTVVQRVSEARSYSAKAERRYDPSLPKMGIALPRTAHRGAVAHLTGSAMPTIAVQAIENVIVLVPVVQVRERAHEYLEDDMLCYCYQARDQMQAGLRWVGSWEP